ncbi:alpha/beta hydrolase [Coxiella endosymbiont of Amblyomma nuttalli]|uniref:alpha/beta hydrolase n=1 Tax=Coxiella endosymbiont of Amblyomma nuttalli TaxID=2749996 RepID=UPI001BA83971|nr:alpha/beta fold hydrolase [Coxiella endosymbiont of Amblyomma nuttalli]QTS84178.1 Alpha/beta hydrolase family protein [Coxiella endosymbiont of Amblyomma nuttalli]
MELCPESGVTFLVAGSVGKLEVMITRPKNVEKSVTGIICHPHPLYGGTMHNKIVTIIAKAFNQLGLKTVRFNFRGVGNSEGQYDNTIGETDDLKTIITWVRYNHPRDEIWLAGFSFGAYISAKVANADHTIARLITIAPAVNHSDYASLTDIICPWWLIIGREDELIPFVGVETFVHDSPVAIKFIPVEKATHFFHGFLIKLREILILELALVCC